MRALVSVFLGFLASGCVTLTETERAAAGGRYSDFVRRVEAELPELSKARTSQLHPLCDAYAKLKRYDKLSACLDQLARNIERGDINVMDRERIEEMAPALMGVGKVAIGIGQLFGAPSYEQLMEHDARPDLHLWRAEALIDSGEYRRAADEAAEALRLADDKSLLGAEHVRQNARLRALTNLTLAHALDGRRAEATAYLDRLEKLPHFSWEEQYAALAEGYLALGKYDKALYYMRRNPEPPILREIAQGGAEAIARLVPGGEDVFVIIKLPRSFMLNRALFETGRFDEARTGYDQLLAIPQTRDNGNIYWPSLYDRGRIAEKDGNRAQAVELYRKSVDVIEGQRATLNTEASKIGFVGDKQAVYQHLVAALLAENRNAEAFEFVERAKSRALVDMLAAKQDFAIHAVDAQKVRTLLAQASSAEAEARVQGGDPSIAGKRSLAVKLKQDLQTQAPELASLVNVTYSSAKDIQARLPADEVLVEYYYDDKKVYAFVITRERLQVVWLEGGNLAQDVKAFREALDSPKDGRHLALSQKLHRQLFQPLETLIAKQNVLVVAHGALHYLPFNALHDGREYVIDRYRLRLLPSASVMPYLRAVRPTSTRALLAFGNPDLGDPRLDLKHAQVEAQSVTKVLPGSRALVRRDASETAFKRQGAGFSYLHFASHGEFNADSPLNSSLLLAKDRENDGTLTVGELYSMRLNADLVTLSACETGLGKIANGDDVVGLTRGFLYAGSRSIVASLWKVDDEATAYLMTRFYSTLKGTSKREALRLAQIETRKKYPHPYYWAAFQLTGEAS